MRSRYHQLILILGIGVAILATLGCGAGSGDYRDAIAYIELEDGSFSSGVLLKDGLILTSISAIYPYGSARIVFPNGEEYEDVEVYNWDLLRGLALLGPVDTDIAPLSLTGADELEIDREVYILGHYGAAEEFVPLAERGTVTSIRVWEQQQTQIFETDIVPRAGQLGGGLFTTADELAGLYLGNSEGTAVAYSTSALREFVDRLLSDNDVNDLGTRGLELEDTQMMQLVLLEGFFDQEMFIVNAQVDEQVMLELNSPNELELRVIDTNGEIVVAEEVTALGTSALNFSKSSVAPVAVQVTNLTEEGNVNSILAANVLLVPYTDPDDGRVLEVGEVVTGNIDFAGDTDRYTLELEAGEAVEITADSLLATLYLVAGVGTDLSRYLTSYGDGGGVWDTNPYVGFQATRDATFTVVVGSGALATTGAYQLSVREAVPESTNQ